MRFLSCHRIYPFNLRSGTQTIVVNYVPETLKTSRQPTQNKQADTGREATRRSQLQGPKDRRMDVCLLTGPNKFLASLSFCRHFHVFKNRVVVFRCFFRDSVLFLVDKIAPPSRPLRRRADALPRCPAPGRTKRREVCFL